MEQIGIAIVGLGHWGARAHLPAFGARDDVSVRALVDPRGDAAESLAREHGVGRVETDAAALFRDSDGIDAVVIATPDDTHRDLVLGALSAGLHVLCEKPLAFDVGQAVEMAAAVQASDRIGKIGFLFRCSPVVARMKDMLDLGFIGDVQLFESITVNAQFADPRRPLHWKMQRTHANGGVFVEYGSHAIDLALWFGGPIARVVAHGVTLIPQRPTAEGGSGTADGDDVCSWIASYADGGQALFRSGWASLPVGGGGLRLYGSRGSLAWQLDPTGRRSEALLAATADDPIPRVVFEFAPPFDATLDEGPFPLGLLARYNARLAASFIADIRAGQVTGPSFADGLEVQRVLAAVRTSLDEDRWVDVE
jgi:predicted dehydrogenase